MTTHITPPEYAAEAVAALVFQAMRFAQPGPTPEWVPGGNSLMQEEARRAARAILSQWGAPTLLARWINEIAVAGGEESDILYALCSDFTVWSICGPHGGVWKQLPPIPQPGEEAS